MNSKYNVKGAPDASFVSQAVSFKGSKPTPNSFLILLFLCAVLIQPLTASTYGFPFVKLITFTVKAVDNGSTLNWSASSQQDNDHFSIERSEYGINFIKIGEVKNVVTSLSIQPYSYTDNVNPPAAGIYYYRIAEVDRSGILEYSNIAWVEFNNQNVGLKVRTEK